MGGNQRYFLEFGGYRLDPFEHQLSQDGRVIALTPKVVETLRLLVENAGRLLEKDRLMEMLWTNSFVEEGNLAGKREQAQTILKEFESQSRKPVSKIETAMIYIALGDHDRAFEWLEMAYAERAWQLGFLKVEPIFDPLRGDPRFADLMRRVNLVP